MTAAKGPLVAGVDCSTQATKVLVIDPDDGRVVAEGRAPHEVTGTRGARETPPEAWWVALGVALAQTRRVRDVGSIAIAGQQHGLVVLDRRHRPLRPAILWNDTRAAADAEHLTEALGGSAVWAEVIGLVPVASFTVAKWSWLRRTSPSIARQVAGIRLPHDFLTERLCGRAVTDRGDASGTGWWSTKTETYESSVLQLPGVDLDRDLLPTVLGPTEAAGEVARSVADPLGLVPGTRVAAGTGDNMAIALGLGAAPGIPILSLGTSGTTFTVSAIRASDPTGTVAGFADAAGAYLPLACTLNCTLAVDRMAALLGIDREDVAPSAEVLAFPYFDGERTPNLPYAAAALTGIRHNTKPGAILMATYEGVLASLFGAMAFVEDHSSGIDPMAPLLLVGGGARGRTWPAVASRLSGRTVLVPDAKELVALGAAVQATAIRDGEDVRAVAERWGTTDGRRLEPPAKPDDTVARHARALAQLMAAACFKLPSA